MVINLKHFFNLSCWRKYSFTINESTFLFFNRLLNYGRSIDLQLQNATKVLEQEIRWIKTVQVCTLSFLIDPLCSIIQQYGVNFTSQHVMIPCHLINWYPAASCCDNSLPHNTLIVILTLQPVTITSFMNVYCAPVYLLPNY